MGVGQVNLIISNLIANGINKNEKVTIVENASFKSERLFFTTLKNCPMFIKRNNINSPSIIIIR
jgi:siroheme synthase